MWPCINHSAVMFSENADEMSKHENKKGASFCTVLNWKRINNAELKSLCFMQDQS